MRERAVSLLKTIDNTPKWLNLMRKTVLTQKGIPAKSDLEPGGGRALAAVPTPQTGHSHLEACPSCKSHHSNTKYTFPGTCPHMQTGQADRAQRRASPAGNAKAA